jgi:2-polyprenyl-3-methyl-5-hydroxy-6-metoxy-1,4-benzoquinol methylase
MSSSHQATLEIMLIIQEYLEKTNLSKEVLVLDVGCGFGQNGSMLKPMSLNTKINCCLLGIDIWSPYLQSLNKTKIYDNLLSCDGNNLPLNNQTKFNIIIATEIIEHLSKKKAEKLIHNLESSLKANGLLILSTPHGNEPQGAIHNNIFENHISAWSVKDLQSLGFQVVTSPLVIKTPMGNIFTPMRSFNKGKDRGRNFILFCLGAISCFIPKISGKIIAYKIKKTEMIQKC